MSDKPWENEPDTLDFESHGLMCALRRHPRSGHWCGYVGIPTAHPLHGVNYSDHCDAIATLMEKRLERPFGNGNIFAALCHKEGEATAELAFEVHGGITHSSGNWPEDNGLWWFGFDCNHCDDAAPYCDGCLSVGVYRTMPYVRGECEALAGQLATIGGRP